MEKERIQQLDLFHEGQGPNQITAQKRLSGSLWGYVSNYEKVVLVIIGFIITGVVAFCMGVENGKSIVNQKTSSKFDIAEKDSLNLAVPKKVLLAPGALKPITPAQQMPPVPVKIQESGGYTIQVASYQTKTNAEKESIKLRQKGFSPLIRSKGSYIIVCVGNFADKETAKSIQSRLRQNYQDCYIRRL